MLKHHINMNPDDYDEDGNNIVPCPICLQQYCPSKDGGKCEDEDEFIMMQPEEIELQ